MTKKIKIMHIINNLEVGGAEKMVVLLLKELAKREDVELYIVSLEGHGILESEIPEKVTSKNFNYKLFNPMTRGFDKIDLHIKPRLISYIKKVKPDIIHGHLYKGEDIAKMSGLLTGIPVVVTCHDTLVWPGKKSRILNKFTSKFIAVSKPVAKHLRLAFHLPDKKISIIPNAIALEEFYRGEKKFDKNNPVFLYIGRILKLKGIDDAIVGIAKLRKSYPNLKLLIYGKEVHKKDKIYLQDIITSNDYKFVEFMGRTDDVPHALSTGDIFVLPSRSEGFAISVLEAAAAKKPVVATRAGAIPDIVKDGVSGILVDYNNPQQIYLACKKIVDENLVLRYGTEARKIAKNKFSINQVALMHVKLYEEVLKNRV